MTWTDYENSYIQGVEIQCRELYKKNMEDYVFCDLIGDMFVTLRSNQEVVDLVL